MSVSLFSDLITLSDNQFICAGDLVELQLTVSDPDIAVNVNWQPDEVIVSGQGTPVVSVQPSQSTWVGVEVMGANECMLQDSILVEISPLSFLDVEAFADPVLIPLGDNSQLLVDPIGAYDYSWSPPDGLTSSTAPDPMASPPVTTTYTVTVIDNDLNGSCAKNDTVTVKVFEFLCSFPSVFVPNAFSPNGDRYNDQLLVRGRYIESFQLRIYDRWGEMVFETSEKDKGWDGTFKGRPLEPAVYVYHLDVICIDGQENFEKGNITLIR